MNKDPSYIRSSMHACLIELHVIYGPDLNGVNLGHMLHSDKACRNMLMFIGEKNDS